MALNPELPERALKHNTDPDPDAEKGSAERGGARDGKEVHYFGAAALVNQNRHSDRLLVLLRLLTFAFAVAAVAVMAANTRTISGSTEKAKWYDFHSYRYVLAVNTIIGTYSLAETGLGVWLLRTGSTLMPEAVAVWFDYGHDQGFAYLLFSAASAGTAVAQGLQSGNLRIQGSYTCADVKSFCFLARLSVGFSFAAFICLAASSLLSGYRVARWLMRFQAADR